MGCEDARKIDTKFIEIVKEVEETAHAGNDHLPSGHPDGIGSFDSGVTGTRRGGFFFVNWGDGTMWGTGQAHNVRRHTTKDVPAQEDI